jgi:hypothetical protein
MSDRLPGLLAAGLWLTGVLAGCGSEPTEPVARLSVSPAEVELGYPESVTLSAEWEMTGPLSADAPWVFVHLLDESGAVVRTFDHELPFPWRPGETRRAPIEFWQSALAPALPAGAYQLTLGLYGPRDGRRWTLETEATAAAGGEYEVAEVRVLAPTSGIELAFDDSWWPAQEGSDLQVLARRWLRQDGSLVLAGLQDAARLELGLRIPEPGKGERQVLQEGAVGARLRVSSPCTKEGAVIGGAGDHEVVLDLRPAADGRCVVRFEPSAVVVDLDSLASRSVALERLTVSPGDG